MRRINRNGKKKTGVIMRIKQVFKNYQELAHVWAAQTQDYGNTPGGRMYFRGPSVYSYGSHFEIARFVKPNKTAPAVVLFTERDYSPTTSKHKGAARRAIDGRIVFTVPDVTGEEHNTNVDYYIDNAGEALGKLPRAHTLDLLREAVLNIRAVNSYLRWFGKHVSGDRKKKAKKLFKNIDSLIPSKLKKTIKQREAALEARSIKARATREENRKLRWAQQSKEYAEREAKRKEKQALDRANLEADCEKWKRGEETDNQFLYDTPVMLRIKENEIQTSRHANIPLIEARKFWNMLGRKENVVGMRLGHYTVDSLDGSTLTVGCHKINMREVYRMAKNLNWALEVI
jgi:hypothetical protein